MKEHFGVTAFMNNSLDVNRSILSRMRNCLIKAIEDKYLLPKLIVILMDADILSCTKDEQMTVYTSLINWLAVEFNKLVNIHKDRLPMRAVKGEYPHFVWIAPLRHVNVKNNYYREKITSSIKTVTSTFNNHIMLQLKKIWDAEDRTLFKHKRLTEIGLGKYWESVDSAIEFWCKHLAPQSRLQSATADRQQADTKRKPFFRGFGNRFQ